MQHAGRRSGPMAGKPEVIRVLRWDYHALRCCETTLNLYTHEIPDTHRRAIERVEQALLPVVRKWSQVGDSGKEAKVVIH